MIASLPMYFPPSGTVEAFWAVLARQLQAVLRTDAQGVGPAEATTPTLIPAELVWPTDYFAHWRQPDLLLSQTCGYPLTHALAGQVQLVGTFAYGVPGADGVDCRSQLICRANDTRQTLSDFANSALAFNSTDSQSGYNALRAMVAQTSAPSQKRPFFKHSIATDAHVQSIECVRQQLADMASIDTVTWALWCEANPEKASTLRVFGQTEAYPGLPLITSLQTPPQVVQALRTALHQVATEGAFADVRAPLKITGFQVTTDSDYARCMAMESAALAAGVTSL